MHTTAGLKHTWGHWLMVGGLMLAAALGLDGPCLHARVALAQWREARAPDRAKTAAPGALGAPSD